MSSFATSTIAALCFVKKPDFEFPELTRDLGEALKSDPRINCTASSSYEDFAVFDLTPMRICLAYCDVDADFPDPETRPPMAASLVISVGLTGDFAKDELLCKARGRLCQRLVDRVESRAPGDELIWLDVDEVFTEDVYDTVLEKVFDMARDNMDELSGKEPDAPMPTGEKAETLTAITNICGDLWPDEPLPSVPSQSTEKSRRLRDELSPDDQLNDLAARFDAELAQRDAAHEEAIALADAEADADTSTPHSAMTEDEARNLFSDEDEKVVSMPRPKRLNDWSSIPRPRRDRLVLPTFDNRATPSVTVEGVPQPQMHQPRRQGPVHPDAVARPVLHGRDPTLAQFREALYEDQKPPEPANERSIPHRLAIYSISASILAFSLPVGAAMMTYFMLGRESLNMAARAMALTGTGIGFTNTEIGMQLVGMLG
ncbi:MAG: hypothetical protein JJ872_13365 [Marivivens sp.]|nr:hypothetical protein [Marivivens sp.]